MAVKNVTAGGKKIGPITRLLRNRYMQSTGVIRAYDMNSSGSRILSILILVICVTMVIVVIFPIIWVLLAGFKDIREMMGGTQILPEAFSFEGYATTWSQLRFMRFYINSGIVVLGGVICAVLFNGLLAYALAILRPPGHRVVFVLVMWSLMIPPTTAIVAQFVNIHRTLAFAGGIFGIVPQESMISFVPLWLIMGANAFWLVLFKEFFESLPKDYIEAARLDGATRMGIFSRIIMPLSRPIIMVIIIFAATAAWSDFLLPFLLLNNGPFETVMVRLFQFRTAIRVSDVERIHAVVFSIIPPILLFALFQKQITKGVISGGIKG